MDDSTLRAQLERFHHAGYGWALRCCANDPDEAEDVLQTVYLKMLDGRAHYDGKAQFKTWLFALIRNTAIDAQRRRQLHKRKIVTYKKRLLRLVRTDDIEETWERSRRASRCRQGLATLSQRQREVLQLVFYHECTLQEAAGIMGVSIGSARTHYERGKKRLRKWMEASQVRHATEHG